MSSNDHNISTERASDTFVFTNSDREPVTCDKNPAHFDGFVLELSDCIERTGEFLAFAQQGVVISGHRTITDSIANIPFILGSVPNAIACGSGNPCPPTAQRVASHNAAAAAAGTPRHMPIVRIPAGVTDIYVNKPVIDKYDLKFGDAIAACFVQHSSFINELRERHGRGGRAMIERLLVLGANAKPEQKILVLREFTKFAESGVAYDLDLKAFEDWYKQLKALHRKLPRTSRKTDVELCEYVNILLYAQPAWRDKFDQRLTASMTGCLLTPTARPRRLSSRRRRLQP